MDYSDDGERQKLDELRRRIDEGQTLLAMEREKAVLSTEILEALLQRIEQLERRVDALEG